MRILDLRLRTKVYGAFAVVLSLDILTGVTATISLDKVNADAARIRDVWLPGVTVAGNLISAVENYRIIEGQMLLTQDENEQLAGEELLWNARDQVFRLRTAYDRVRPHDVGTDRHISAELAAFDSSWQGYQDRSKRMVGYVYPGMRDLSMARDIYNQAGGSFRAAGDYLREVLAFNASEASEATERSKTIETVATRLILLVTIGATLTSWLLGLYIVTSVGTPVAALTRVVRRMADDDLTADAVLTDNRQDEIGVMTVALHDLRARLVERHQLIEEEKESLLKLQRAERELLEAERLAALGRMVAGVSHEINTPLGSAYTVATTLVEAHRDFAGLLGKKQLRRSDLEQFVDRVGRASDLISVTLEKANVLIRTFKQVAVDQTSSSRRRFDLNELVRQVVMTTSPLFKTRNYRLELDISDSVEMDSFPGPLGQVLGNLLSNAVIHGLDDKEDGRITIRVRQEGRDIVDIFVTDDGNGILPEHMPHLFEPFFTTRFGQGGSGLGLNIVHGIITNVLGGTIDVTSNPGQGTTFAIAIPVTAPEQPQPDQPGEPQPVELSSAPPSTEPVPDPAQ